MIHQRIKLSPNFSFIIMTQSTQIFVPRLPAESPTSITDSTRLPSFPNTYGVNFSRTWTTDYWCKLNSYPRSVLPNLLCCDSLITILGGQ